MNSVQLPVWSSDWAAFLAWERLTFAIGGLVAIILFIIWWRQQSQYWFRITISTFLIAFLFCASSYYLFVVPPYNVGCPSGCVGWRGYPLSFAQISFDGLSQVDLPSFTLNLLALWLLWLGASMIWYLLGSAMDWWKHTLRWKLFFILILCILPWAILPRLLNPPQPQATGEELRLAINARRAAEFTYRITGLWVQRLTLEDIKRIPPDVKPESLLDQERMQNQVCLRGYIYFYLPWKRYRITLDSTGVTALNLTEIPLEGSCWP